MPYYCKSNDHVLCHVCVRAVNSNRMTVGQSDAAFITKGFSNWKDGTIAFKNHEVSSCHKEALQVIVVIPSSCPDVGAMLSRHYSDEMRNNRKFFLKIMATTQYMYLAWQGIALRGDGNDTDSNFI